MSAALVPDRVEDVEPLAGGDRFAFAAPEPVWAPLMGERPRAAVRLLAFVTAVGLGSGFVLWIVGDMIVTAFRSMF
jgi:hypothetical protein